jgi:hypothetical protein
VYLLTSAFDVDSAATLLLYARYCRLRSGEELASARKLSPHGCRYWSARTAETLDEVLGSCNARLCAAYLQNATKFVEPYIDFAALLDVPETAPTSPIEAVKQLRF